MSGETVRAADIPGYTAEQVRAFVRGEGVDLKVAMVVQPVAELHRQARCVVELLTAGHVPMGLLKAKALEKALAAAAGEPPTPEALS